MLDINDEKGNPVGVYDPYSRNGGQIITDKKLLEQYKKREHKNIEYYPGCEEEQ